ncbi:MAG: 6,7-dimethyl-8-ribityllumazine synthase [Coxiellaceae bacterium]|nr:6,7-dimethyl-8-ribityllumazine synthase [Coxiellaceae bacterium]
MSVSLAIVYSRFNTEVTDMLLQGAQARLKELGFDVDEVPVYQVPGAVEIPLVAKKLAKSNRYDAVICLGAIIRGETTHYDYVCDQVSQGCQQVMMEFELPVIFGVLTTENKAQALDRCGGAHGHKGCDAVDAAVEMVALLEKV